MEHIKGYDIPSHEMDLVSVVFNKTISDAETSDMGPGEGHQEVPVPVC